MNPRESEELVRGVSVRSVPGHARTPRWLRNAGYIALSVVGASVVIVGTAVASIAWWMS